MEKIRYIIALSLSLICAISLAQSSLSLSDVVPMDGYTADALLHNADSYFSSPVSTKKKKKKSKSEKEIIRDESSVAMEKSTLVYSKSIAKHPLGNVTYTYTVEVKDNKYRYIFSSMVFTPYERNRYGKFEPVSGKRYSIESILGNEKFRYRKDILHYLDGHIATEAGKLHSRMSEVPHAENSGNKENKGEDW